MLCLKVREGENLHIGDVRIFFKRIGGSSAELAIEAPPAVKVLRGKVKRREEQAKVKREDAA